MELNAAAPYFSIIMPTYNRGYIIGRTLHAILDQSFKNFEVVVLDDGGKDNTEDVVMALKDTRLRYIKQQNTGALRARANACDLAKGSWLAFCDSDDTWKPDYLETLYRTIKTLDTDTVFADYTVEGEQQPRIMGGKYAYWFKYHGANGSQESIAIGGDTLYELFMDYQPIMPSAMAMSHEHYKQIGGIKKELDVIGSEDAHLTQRAVALGKPAFIPKSVVDMGRGDDNLSSNYVRNLEGGMLILQDFVANRLIPTHLNKFTIKAIAEHQFELARQYYWNRNMQRSLSYVMETNVSQVRFKHLRLILKIFIRNLLKK